MERVLILGATSAIAAEVAVLHALRGDTLYLVGRNATKLDHVAQRCGQVQVYTQVADFTDHHASPALISHAISTLGGVDRVLIAHGLLPDQLKTEQDFHAAHEALNTNFLSVVSLLIPLVNHLEQAGRGRLAVITSVAGERGRPRNYTYGAAKGALNLYLQGVRSRLHGRNIHITTLKLGPVDTPMTLSHPKNPLFGKPITVAHDILHAMDAGAGEVYVPSFWRWIMPVVRHTPEFLFQRVKALSGR